ncbi:hypothetical protein BV20DRAFT_1122881 [Pilatotrama ljubarskyi]|nr:hypothetical protein BV20DRAFT_1122881 [Pilatotrama ljubarskyi]
MSESTTALTHEATVDTAPSLVIIVVFISALWLSGIFAYLLNRKWSTRAVLRITKEYQAQTLKILRRGVDVIPLNQQAALLERYMMIAADIPMDLYRDRTPRSSLPAAPGHWRRLQAAAALRDAAAEAFERSESNELARILHERGKTVLNGHPTA